MAALAEDKESGSKVNKEFLISSATAANTLLSAVPQATAPSALVGTGLTLWGALPEKDSSTVYPSASLQASAYITAMRLGLVAAPGPDAGAASWYDARSGKVYLGNAQAVEDFNAWMLSSGRESDASAALKDVGIGTYDYWTSGGNSVDDFQKSHGIE